MPIVQPRMQLRAFLVRARQALGISQARFGEALDASKRSATRWEAGQARPSTPQLQKLARLLVNVNVDLATESAAHAGDTLASLGLVKPEAPKPVVAAAAPPLSDADRLDVVLCAVADQAGATPRSFGPLLLTAFRRAREVGLSVEAAERALAARTATTPDAAASPTDQFTPQP